MSKKRKQRKESDTCNDKVVCKQEGVKVAISFTPYANTQWTEVLVIALRAVKAHYSYLTMKDILEHLNDEFDFLLEEKDNGIEVTISDDDNDIADSLRDSSRIPEEGDEIQTS
jgi:hypothetical protein